MGSLPTKLFASSRSSGSKNLSFEDFIRRVDPQYGFYRHNRTLIDLLQRVADGEIKRLMAFMPPRHFKSQTVSRLFSAYWLYRYPSQWVAIASYGAELAEGMSREARDRYEDAGGVIRRDSSSVKRWQTVRGGGMLAAGVRVGLTGRGYSLGIIDDPVRDQQDAQSPTVRESIKAWYRSVWTTRQTPTAAMVIVQTRWHEEDLAGWLLAEEVQRQYPERWTVLSMPAISEADAPKFPSSCTVVSDWREPGEALCPEHFDSEWLAAKREEVGSYDWASLYQQRPAPLEGGIIKRHWWRYWQPEGANFPPVMVRLADGGFVEIPAVEIPVTFDEMLQSWDLSFKDASTSDYCAGQVWGRVGSRKFLLDYDQRRVDVTATVSQILSWGEKWPDATAKLIEDKANGPAVIQMLRGKTSGVIGVNPEGNKLSRVYAVQPEIEAGDVYLPHPRLYSWVDGFVSNCAAFPNAAHDDDVDAMSQALVRLRKSGVEYAPSIWR